MGTVLVVDDDDTMRQTLRRVLTRAGWHVHLAHDEASALFAARASPFNAAVVDQNLTGALDDRSGLKLADRLLRDGSARRVVILTAYTTPDAAFYAGRHGAMDYLGKPATVGQILASVTGAPGAPDERPCGVTLERLERDHCARVLADCGGRMGEASRRLGVHRNSLARILARRTPR